MPDTRIDQSDSIPSIRLKVPTGTVPVPPVGFGQLHTPSPGVLALRLPDGEVVEVGPAAGGDGNGRQVLAVTGSYVPAYVSGTTPDAGGTAFLLPFDPADSNSYYRVEVNDGYVLDGAKRAWTVPLTGRYAVRWRVTTDWDTTDAPWQFHGHPQVNGVDLPFQHLFIGNFTNGGIGGACESIPTILALTAGDTLRLRGGTVYQAGGPVTAGTVGLYAALTVEYLGAAPA